MDQIHEDQIGKDSDDEDEFSDDEEMTFSSRNYKMGDPKTSICSRKLSRKMLLMILIFRSTSIGKLVRPKKVP